MVEHRLPFEKCRILDLTDDGRMLCGKILAEMGADVIKIEPPGGSASRMTGPFLGGKSDPEKSFSWFALNSNKRSITLNLDSSEGKELFKSLAARSAIVVESYRPGYMKAMGIDYLALLEINPAIVVTSISDFGQDGPYRDFNGSDLVLMALSGYLYLCGDSDRPPVRMSSPQAYFHAGAEAAAASAMGYYHRVLTGEGQHIDVSAQESLLWLSMQAQMYWNICGINPERVGPCWITAATGNRSLLNWECKDGFITFLLMGGAEAAKARELVNLMKEEDMAPEFLDGINWEKDLDLNRATQEKIDLVSGPIANFFRQSTKAKLFQKAIERGTQLFPAYTVEEILEDPQLSYRDFWANIEVESDNVGLTLRCPGDFGKFSKTPLRKATKAPNIGEHNYEIYAKELGLNHNEIKSYQNRQII